MIYSLKRENTRTKRGAGGWKEEEETEREGEEEGAEEKEEEREEKKKIMMMMSSVHREPPDFRDYVGVKGKSLPFPCLCFVSLPRRSGRGPSNVYCDCSIPFTGFVDMTASYRIDKQAKPVRDQLIS